MNFKEVRHSNLRLAWMYQRMKAHQIIKKFGPWQPVNLLLLVVFPVGVVVMAIREGNELQERHDAIVSHVERYWESQEKAK